MPARPNKSLSVTEFSTSDNNRYKDITKKRQLKRKYNLYTYKLIALMFKREAAITFKGKQQAVQTFNNNNNNNNITNKTRVAQATAARPP